MKKLIRKQLSTGRAKFKNKTIIENNFLTVNHVPSGQLKGLKFSLWSNVDTVVGLRSTEVARLPLAEQLRV